MMMWTFAVAFVVVYASAGLSGVPVKPSGLKILLTGMHEVKVAFTAGLDGGAPQTFTIDYNVKDRHPQVIRGIEDPKDTRTVAYTIRNLLAGTTYYIKVKAVNAFGHSRFTEAVTVVTAAKSDTENTFPMTELDIIGATISVFLFAIAVGLVIAIVVKLRRKNAYCFAVQCLTKSPATNLGEANLREREAAHVNEAFEGPAEPEYVNVPQRIRDSNAEANLEKSIYHSPYVGLGMRPDHEAEDHSYETLTTGNTRF